MVNKKCLILANGLLWAIAGSNILRIGVQAALNQGGWVWLWFIPVFMAFGAMFFRVISKNTRRIEAMECDKAPLYRFLTLKGYLIIAFMMTLGITLRRLGSIPESFFAFFYTGLGGALTTAGLFSFIKEIVKR